MAEDLSVQGLAADMLGYVREMHNLQFILTKAAREAAQAEALYRREHAKARLASDKRNEDSRGADADEKCYELMLARNVARNGFDAAKVQAANLRALLSGCQSLLNLERADARAAA